MINRGSIVILFCFLVICCTNYEKTYYSDGTLKTKSTSLGIEESGEYFSYYPSGRPKIETYWKGNVSSGRVTVFFESGVVHQITNWRNGRLHTEAVQYYPNGKLKIRSNYQNGCKVGLYEVFYESGSISEKWLFDNKCRLYFFATWDTAKVLVNQIFHPLVDLSGEVRDSIMLQVYSPVELSGFASIQFGKKENGKFYTLSKRHLLSDGNANVLISRDADLNNLHYRFEYEPAKSDTLARLGLEMKAFPKNDTISRLKSLNLFKI